jgi:pimeloyl-ACP methyl ester carboxylesterase
VPVPPSTETLLLTTGALTLEVLLDGPEQGPALVLLPSSLRDSRDFDPLVRPLAAAGWRVLRPQPRGMGGSRGAMDGLTLAHLAGDVHQVIKQLGGGRAVLVGHAFGHFIARLADRLFPAAVRGVVVLAGAARVFPAGLQDALLIASDPAQAEAARLQALQHAFFAPGQDARPWLQGWHPQLRAVYRAASADPPKDHWWPFAQSPILDLQGEHDPWRPADTRDELRATLGADRVTVQVLPGASHAMVPEQPAAAAAAIHAWAERLSGR